MLDKQRVQMSPLSASQCLSSIHMTASGFSSAGPVHLAMVCGQIWGNFYVCVFSSVYTVGVGLCLTVLLVGVYQQFRKLCVVFSRALIMDISDLFK